MTATQVAQWQGVKKGVNMFYARQTALGQWVTDSNSKIEFPEVFTGSEGTVNLTVADFPAPKI